MVLRRDDLSGETQRWFWDGLYPGLDPFTIVGLFFPERESLFCQTCPSTVPQTSPLKGGRGEALVAKEGWGVN